jgi:hypothetical protein
MYTFQQQFWAERLFSVSFPLYLMDTSIHENKDEYDNVFGISSFFISGVHKISSACQKSW